MKSLASRRPSDTQKVNREHYVAMILVLIILVYATCHSIRKVGKVEHLLDVLMFRCYFNVTELLGTAGGDGDKKTTSINERLRCLLFVGSDSPSHAEFSTRMMIATAVSHLLITVNSSINFAIYCIKVNNL